MGEKGNITSAELAAAGAGAVGATTVTAVIEDAGDTLKDKVLDKGADASIEAAKEKWRSHRAGDSEEA